MRSLRALVTVRAAAGVQEGDLGAGVDLAGGSRPGILPTAACAEAARRSAAVIFLRAAWISRVFLSGAGIAGWRTRAARSARARPSAASAARAAVRAVFRAWP